jgi:flagellar basal body rod protein FlgG
VLGQLELACFAPENLVPEGATLFRATAAPLAAPPPKIVAGSVEASNFNVVDGMVDLIRTTRTYQALQSMIETYRDMDNSIARDGNA